MVSTMPSAVSGLTKHEAPSAGVVPAGSTRQSEALTTRYCEYIAPPISATVLPSSALAASDDPVLITTPAPSLPTGIDSSSRAAIAFSAASGTFAVTTGCSLVPETLAVDISAGPIRSPRSDGLIGEASTRTTTSSSPGSGVGILASDSSSSPLFFNSERSCSPVLPSLILTSSLPAVQHPVADPRFACPEPLAIWSLIAMMSSRIDDLGRAPAPRRSPARKTLKRAGAGYALTALPKIVETATICPFATTFGAEKATASDTWLCNLALLGAYGGRDLEPAA